MMVFTCNFDSKSDPRELHVNLSGLWPREPEVYLVLRFNAELSFDMFPESEERRYHEILKEELTKLGFYATKERITKRLSAAIGIEPERTGRIHDGPNETRQSFAHFEDVRFIVPAMLLYGRRVDAKLACIDLAEPRAPAAAPAPPLDKDE